MKLPFDTDDGIGTRATFGGVIVLEADETLEPEFARVMGGLEGGWRFIITASRWCLKCAPPKHSRGWRRTCPPPPASFPKRPIST